MKVLGFDQSVKRSGWALVERAREGMPARPVAWGSFTAGGVDRRAKVDAFVAEVRDIIDCHAPDVVVWESPSAFMGAHGVTARTLILTRLDEALTRVCEQLDIACSTVAANTWRAKILGKGAGRLARAEAKRRAMQYVDWLGLRVTDDDQAEAICIAMWGALYAGAVVG